jgi:hypothetical protein
MEVTMPQISLYIDEPTLKKVAAAAKKENTSISKWVAAQVRERVEPSYPEDYEQLFGSISDESFVEPGELASSADNKREEL